MGFVNYLFKTVVILIGYFCLIYDRIDVSSYRFTRPNFASKVLNPSTSRVKFKISLESVESNTVEVPSPVIKNVNQPVNSYNGPIAPSNSMELSFYNADIGIYISVGPSMTGFGRGLFFSIPLEVDKVTLPKGTQICDYSKGDFLEDHMITGDKSVEYCFHSPYAGIIYNNEIMPLIEAIFAVTSSSSSWKQIAYTVSGHILSADNPSRDVTIQSDPQYPARTFVPHEVKLRGNNTFRDNSNNNSDICNSNLSAIGGKSTIALNSDVITDDSNIMYGVFANDFAYNSDVVDAKVYESIANQCNILSLIWRLGNISFSDATIGNIVNKNNSNIVVNIRTDESKGENSTIINNNSSSPSFSTKLIPLTPVVVMSTNVTFTNHVPMEVGLYYGCEYWFRT